MIHAKEYKARVEIPGVPAHCVNGLVRIDYVDRRLDVNVSVSQDLDVDGLFAWCYYMLRKDIDLHHLDENGESLKGIRFRDCSLVGWRNTKGGDARPQQGFTSREWVESLSFTFVNLRTIV